MKAGQVLGMAGLAACIALASHSSYAFDFNGAWATDVAKCSDMFGSGFIARKDAIVGNNATCKILSQKPDGPVTHLVAQCASENVAFSTFQFSYRIKDDNNIVRIYPGVEELNQTYGRCNF